MGPKDSASATKMDPTVTGIDNGAIVNPNNISDTVGSRTGTADSVHNGHADKKDTARKQQQ